MNTLPKGPLRALACLLPALFLPAALAAERAAITIGARIVEYRGEGHYDILSAPRVTTSAGNGALVQVTDDTGAGVSLAVEPSLQSGMIVFQGEFQLREHATLESLTRPPGPRITIPETAPEIEMPDGTRLKLPPSEPAPDATTAPADLAAPEAPGEFPANLRIRGYIALPAKPARINLEDLATGSKQWLAVGETFGELVFESVDLSLGRPVAILRQGEQTARVALDAPVLAPMKVAGAGAASRPPLKPGDMVTNVTSVVHAIKPGERVLVPAGYSQSGYPVVLILSGDISQ